MALETWWVISGANPAKVDPPILLQALAGLGFMAFLAQVFSLYLWQKGHPAAIRYELERLEEQIYDSEDGNDLHELRTLHRIDKLREILKKER